MLSARARRGKRHGTIGGRGGGDGRGGPFGERVAARRRDRARCGGRRRLGGLGPPPPARPAHPARAASRGRSADGGVRARDPRQPAPAAGRDRGLAQPRATPSAITTSPCRESCRSRRSHDDLAPRLPGRDGHRPAPGVRVHGVRRRPRPPRLRGLRARGRPGAALRRLHLRLATRPRGERAGASPSASRASRGRRAIPPHASTSWATAWAASWRATTCATAGPSRPPDAPVTWAGAPRVASVVLAATPNAGSIPALGAILSGERVGLSYTTLAASVVSRMPSCYQLLPPAGTRPLVDPRGKPLDRRPARPRDVGALRLGTLRPRLGRPPRAPSARFSSPLSSGRGPSTPRSRARRPHPAPCPSTRSAATACSPSPARWRAKARPARPRGSRPAPGASRTCCTRPATGA